MPFFLSSLRVATTLVLNAIPLLNNATENPVHGFWPPNKRRIPRSASDNERKAVLVSPAVQWILGGKNPRYKAEKALKITPK